MTNKFMTIFLLTTILLITIASATPIMSTELVKSQYPLFITSLGFGDSIYKYTYSDGSSELIYKRQNILNLFPASVIPTNPTSIGDTWIVGESPKIYYDINGIGTSFDGLTSHQHTVTTTNEGGNSQQIYIKAVTVPSDGTVSGIVSLGVKNTPGDYTYKLKETIRVLASDMNYTTLTGDIRYVTISVINCADSDITIIPLPDGSSIKTCNAPIPASPTPTPTSTTVTPPPVPTIQPPPISVNITPIPIPTPNQPSIQPPDISTIKNSLTSFLKTLFPFLQM